MPLPIQWECEECQKPYTTFDDAAACEHTHYEARIAAENAAWEADHPGEPL